MTLASGEDDVSWILANTGEGAPVAVGLNWIGSQSNVTNCNLESGKTRRADMAAGCDPHTRLEALGSNAL